MKKIVLFSAAAVISIFSFAQKIDKVITPAEVERIEKVLSSDDMQGRKIFTPSIDKAGDFIADEFKKNGLEFYKGLDSYKQSFTMVRPKFISAKGSFAALPVDTKDIVAFTSIPEL